MITIIQGTNRPDSHTAFISRQVEHLLTHLGEDRISYMSLANLPGEVLSADVFESANWSGTLTLMQEEMFIKAEKFIWIVPEYNGSFPGILKLFLDVLSVRKPRECFAFKKSLLIGVATGRAGNIRGMDHLADVLQHLHSVVFPKMLPISRVSDLVDESGQIIHEPTLHALKDHLESFLAF